MIRINVNYYYYDKTSCGLKTGYLKYEGKSDEIIVTKKIKEFMKKMKVLQLF